MKRSVIIKTVLGIIILLLILYVKHYYSYPLERQVVQTSLNTFNFDQLLARQPLVIQDRIKGLVGLEELGKLWFPNNHKQTFISSVGSWARTSHKHTLILNESEPVEVLVLHPVGTYMSDKSPHPDETLTAISLEANQVLILPLHTVFLVDKEKTVILAVHDWITRFLPF